MEWLQSLFSSEGSTGLQLVLITLGLVVILILLFWIFRKIIGTPASRAARNRIPRLSVTDATVVDDKRRLVLVRRDDVEHLVLIGGPTDVVVETNVIRTQAPANSPARDETDSNPDTALLTAAVAATGAVAASTATASDNEATDEAGESDDLSTEESVAEISEAVDTIVEEDNEVPAVDNPDDLESSISAGLDDALSDETITIDEPPFVSTEEPANDVDKPDTDADTDTDTI